MKKIVLLGVGIGILLLIGSTFVGPAGYEVASRSESPDRVCPYGGGIDPKTGLPFDPETAERALVSPLLKSIDLTDDGEIVNRCQWSDVLFELKASNGPLSNVSKIIVIYVHGWKHDSSPTDEDRVEFTRFITHLDMLEKARSQPRQVIGIFVGWPGSVTRIPVVRELTFWSRKRAADRVSQAGTLTKLIGAANHIRQQRDRPDDLIVAIGHSFGARILYDATSQLLLYNVEMHHPGIRTGQYEIVNGPIDLLVLLNPALEAATYTAIDSLRRMQESFNPNQRPLVLEVATDDDLATKIAFPLGQRLGYAWRPRQTTTLGNYDAYVTHSLRRHSAPPAVDRVKGPDEHRDAEASDRGRPADSWYDEFCTQDICLTRSDHLQPGNPFIVARTHGDILHGHGGIWEDSFAHWLAEFIREVDHRRVTHTAEEGRDFHARVGTSIEELDPPAYR